MTPDELRAIKERDRLCTAENATLKSVLEDCAEADRRALLAEVEALSRDLAEMRRQRDAYKLALLEIASCPCTNTISPCRAPHVCVTCIARAALAATEPKP
ncbi:MAG: hypothetical protein KGL39_53800 [Patescibacteria group bacterium]|nr:hypothetical protein [Patescibacteria group bacterium]